jgi:hypothetical protein
MVVRELRQTVRNGAALAMVGSLLAGYLLLMVAGAMGAGAELDSGHGARLATWILLSLAALATLGVPLWAGLRLNAELARGDLDMVAISALSGARIFWGKVWAAMLYSLVAMTVALPFAVSTVIMRGVDFASIVFGAAISLACGFGATVLTVAVGSLARTLTGRIVALVVLPPMLLTNSSVAAMYNTFVVHEGAAAAMYGIVLLAMFAFLALFVVGGIAAAAVTRLNGRHPSLALPPTLPAPTPDPPADNARRQDAALHMMNKAAI